MSDVFFDLSESERLWVETVPWRCERCKASGIVNTTGREPSFSVVTRIRDEHDEISPNCDPIVRLRD